MATPQQAPQPSVHTNISRIVAGLMAVHGEKQAAIAPLLGISPSGVSEKIRGRRDWSIEDISALAAHYDVSVALFFTDAEQVFRAQNWKKLNPSDLRIVHGDGISKRDRSAPRHLVAVPAE